MRRVLVPTFVYFEFHIKGAGTQVCNNKLPVSIGLYICQSDTLGERI